MSPRRRRAAELGELHFTITDDDVMESLSWPGPPPGRWRVPRDTDHVDALLRAVERAHWPAG